MTRPDDQQTALLPPMKWNAWGDPAAAKPLSDGIRALLKQALGVDGATTPDLEAAGRASFARPRCRTPTATGSPSHRRSRLLPCRRPGPAAARRRQVDAGPVAPQGFRCPGCARRGAPAAERRRDRRDPAVLLRPRDRDRPVRRRHECGRRPRPDPRRFQRGGLAGSAPADELHSLDEVSGEAELGAGLTGPEAERLLGERGFSLGHFPQSFQFATIGGFAATRSSGQDSAGYGRFNDMVRGLRAVTPAGVLDLGRAPESAAGPDLRQLMIGSEGVFGIITRVRVKVHPGPRGHPLRGVVVPRLRDRRRRTARRRADRRRADGHPVVRRGRDRREPGHHREHRRRADHRRLPGDHGVRGQPRPTSRAVMPKRAR